MASVALLLAVALFAGTILHASAVPEVAGSSAVSPWFQGEGLRLEAIQVEVDAAESLARTALHFDIANPTNITREAVIDVPLPPHATLTGFTLHLDNETWTGKVQERATARQDYDAAKERGEDAVLLEQADAARFRLSLNAPAGADRVLEVTYLQSVGLESGARSYRLGLSALSHAGTSFDTLTATVRLESASGLGTVHYPGMDLQPIEEGTHRHRATGNADPNTALEDLVVLWTEGEGAWRPTLVSSVPPGAVGSDNSTLVASIVPPETDQGLPRDLVFILDTSGSMSGEKMVQARESLREVLLTLRPGDRYGLVTFESTVTRITPELQPVTDTGIQEDRRTLAAVSAKGGTDFAGGLLDGLELLADADDPERVPIVVMLSDGMPTSGITDHSTIVASMEATNTRGAAVHLLAIGLDADDTFLEDIAGRTGGTLTTLHPDDDLKTRLNRFYASLEDPVLSHVQVTITGPDVRERYPTVLPALYKGDTLRFAFRADLTEPEPIHVHLEGISGDGPVVEDFVFETNNISVLPQADRLWGSLHVSTLLSRERTEGTSETLRAEIIDAAIQYGIVTRHTSWVITAPVPRPADTSAEASGGATPTTAPTHAAHRIVGDTNLQGEQADSGGGSGSIGAPDAAEDAATPAPALMLVLAVVAAALALLRRRN